MLPYYEDLAVTYARMLDPDAEEADWWREVTRIVLHIDPDREPDRAWQAFESHFARAKMGGKAWILAVTPARLASRRQCLTKAGLAPSTIRFPCLTVAFSRQP